jgi:preprotein translocase subunit YajC
MIYQNIFTFLAQAAPQAQQTGGGSTPIIMMVCIVAIFYFMIIRPQSQKAKQQQTLISSIKTGDKVVTSAGMHGLVANVKDNTVLVKFADNVKIEVDKSAIAVVTKRTDDDATPAS